MKRAAQSTVEYLVIITIAALALAAMAVYAKRSLQGRIRAGADQISSEGAYAPAATEASGSVTRSIIEDSSSRVDKSGSERKSVTHTDMTINQHTTKDEKVDVSAEGG